MDVIALFVWRSTVEGNAGVTRLTSRPSISVERRPNLPKTQIRECISGLSL